MIPRYLFRADSPGSDGCNDRFGFSCQAFRYENEVLKTLNDMEEDEARRMLQDHVLWRSWELRQDDILISFSSSFLFVVQHCIRKIAKCWKTTKDNCFITILDTHCYPNGTFQWTVHLLDKYGLDENDDKNLWHKYHEGEYLAEYHLFTLSPDEACRVPFSCVQSSMYNIAPDLKQPQYQQQLVVALNTFRTEWYTEPEAISKDDMLEAYALACKFGGKWFVPIAIWALAMKYRMKDDVQKLADRLLGMDDFPSPFMFNDGTTVPTTLRELKEWNFLMETLFLSSGIHKRDSDSPEQILESLANLQISENQ